MNRRLRPRVLAAALIGAAAVALSGAVVAQHAAAGTAPVRTAANTGGPAWQSLSPQQRSALAPLQADWSGIDASRKAKWLAIARRFPQLPAEEQQRLHGRMADWARLSPSERARARLNFQETKQMPAQDRQAMWQAYQALPEGERQALASRSKPAAAPGGPQGSAPPTSAAKRNIVANPSLTKAPAKAVAPTVVQAAPGATTTLVTREPKPPAHQQSGMPKIAATPGFVDRTTLLPKRGPQGAATRSASSNAQPPSKNP
ncbi:MAG: DUF3106 domain-containing protein [Burkholderiaceae bacterium]